MHCPACDSTIHGNSFRHSSIPLHPSLLPLQWSTYTLTLFFSCSRVLSNFFVFPLACFKSSRHFTSCFSKSANFSFVSSTSFVNFSKSLLKQVYFENTCFPTLTHMNIAILHSSNFNKQYMYLLDNLLTGCFFLFLGICDHFHFVIDFFHPFINFIIFLLCLFFIFRTFQANKKTRDAETALKPDFSML